MAIGDSFGIIMGTANETRQPSAGVIEQLSAIVKAGTADPLSYTDGSNLTKILVQAINTAVEGSAAGATALSAYNMAVGFSNSLYLNKTGTTDTIAAQGVQIDA